MFDTNKMKTEAIEIAGYSRAHFARHWRAYVIGTFVAMASHGCYAAYSYYNSTEYLVAKNLDIAQERSEYADDRINYAKPIWEDAEFLKRSMSECAALNSSGSVTDCETYESTIRTNPGRDDSFQSEHVEYVPPKLLDPKELLGPTKVSDRCYVSQTESDHVIQKNGGMFATDLACNFGEGLGKRAEVYAPDLRDKGRLFIIEHVGKDELLGSFVQLRVLEGAGSPSDESFYLGHTETKLKVGDVVGTGQRIGQMTMDGATTGWHVHFEYRRLGTDGKTWKSERYFTGAREAALDNKRKGILPTGHKWGDEFYFTSYNLGDVNQNDSSPCHGASGKNLCDLVKNGEKPIALTVDVRKSLGVKFGDKVKLVGPCTDTYSVEDEMNQRFRYTCVKKDGVCIKGDIGIPKESAGKCSGKYVIAKA